MLPNVLKYICSLLLLIPMLLIILSILSPLYLIRFFVSKILIRCYPKVDKVLTTRSSILAGGRGRNPIYGHAPDPPKAAFVPILVLEGRLELDHLQHIFLTRVIQPKNLDGGFRKPEFQQYVTKIWGFYCWKWEENFDIRDHIQIYNGKFKEQFENGTKPVNATTLTEVTNELLYNFFKPKKSPWEAHIIHNYQEMDPVTGLPAGPVSTAVMFRLHHVLCDGFSFMKTIAVDMAQQQKLETGLPSQAQSRHGNGILLKTLNFFLSSPYDLVKDWVSANDVNSWHVPEERLKRAMNLGISHSIPMKDLKEVMNLYIVSFTALILECFTAAMRRFMAEAGFEVPDQIHCILPLPVPGHPDKMRNHM